MRRTEAPWLHAAIGAGLRRLREEHDLRMVDIVAAARGRGLMWATSSVTQLEAGTRRVTVEELALLGSVIETAVLHTRGETVRDVGLRRLLAHTTHVRLTDTTVVDVDDLLKLIRSAAGNGVAPTPALRVSGPPAADALTDPLERRVADRTGEPLAAVQEVAAMLWGDGFGGLERLRDAEVRRHYPDATGRRRQTLRGYVGRILATELETAVRVAATVPRPRRGGEPAEARWRTQVLLRVDAARQRASADRQAEVDALTAALKTVGGQSKQTVRRARGGTT